MSSQKSAKPDARPQSGAAAINALWDEAAKTFKAICGQSLQNGDIKSFDDVQKTIEGKVQGITSSDSPHQAEWNKAKSVGLQSLEYLKLLVSVAAQGASFIPVPTAAASMASSALCFVFDIPQAIKGYNDAINQVFSEISSTLAQVQVYKSMDKLDPALVQQIHLVMVSFVKLSAHVVKYQQGSKRDRFLHKIKAGILHDDSELAAEMTEFKRVLQQQRDVEGTVTLAVVVKTEQNVSILMERSITLQETAEVTKQGVQTLLKGADRVNQLKKIRETLDLLGAVDFSETKTSAIRTEYAQKCLLDTGEWIWDHEAYKKWTTSTKRDGAASHVLFVSGPPSSGKTLACALITKRLEVRKEGDRTYVAHYFFPKSKDSDITSPAQLALKDMAFQIASTDPTVQDTLYKACQADNAGKAFASGNLTTLWEKLRIGGPGSGQKYYLVFDGLESLDADQIKKLVDFILGLPGPGDSKSAGHVRVLVSGSAKFHDLETRTSLRIDMKESNVPDMKIFIKHKLAEKGMLQNPKPKSDQERARDSILEQLPKKVNGSYSSLIFRIGEVIPLLSTRNAMEKLFRKLDQDISSDEMASKTLQSLTADESDELNELLKWVLFGGQPLDLQQLEAAMLPYSGTQSLVPLQYMIENKYPEILGEHDGFVYVKDVIRDYLMKTSDTSRTPPPTEQDSLISMTITVKNVDQETCGNFLWDLAHKSNREKFKFDFQEAFNANNSSQTTIAVDEIDAHHTIVQRIFKYLRHESGDQTTEFGTYAFQYLPHHLRRLLSLYHKRQGPLRPHELQEIGKNLYVLFKDNEVFQSHKAIIEKVYWDVKDMEAIRDWLTESWVVMGIEDMPWRDQVKQVYSPARSYLQNFARWIVENLLRKRSGANQSTFAWLQQLMQADKKAIRVASRADLDQTSSPSTSDTDNIDWDHISIWCRDFLGLSNSELDSLWYEQLASIAGSQDNSDMSTVFSLYDRALKGNNPSIWLCHRGLGETYYRHGEFDNALEHMEEALTEVGKHKAMPSPEKEDIFDLKVRVGQCALETGNMQRATECFSSASHISETSEQTNRAQLGLLKAKLCSATAGETREWLHSTLAGESGEDQMVQILKMAAKDYGHEAVILRLIAVACEDTDLRRVVARVLETATARSTNGEELTTMTDKKDRLTDDCSMGVLLYYRGIAAYTYEGSTEPNESIPEALRLWEECRNELSANLILNWNYIAYLVRCAALVETARHHFSGILDADQLDDTRIEPLVRLAEAEREYGTLYASGLLAALHAHRGDAIRSRTALMKRVRTGFQMLSDETPDNDQLGFSIIREALVQNGDFVNAAIAHILSVYPDPLAAALTIRIDDVLDGDGVDKRQVLDLVTQLADSTLNFVNVNVSATLDQEQRFSHTIKHVDSCLIALRSGQTVVDPNPDPNSEAAAYEHIRAKLCAQQKKMTYEMDWRWMCNLNGRSLNRKASPCDTGNLYHCVYCEDVDFCEECLSRLRNLEDPYNRHITSCSSKHRWLKYPPPSSGIYVGPDAAYVRTPKVRYRAGDDQILEIIEDGDVQVPISVAMWRKELMRTWSVALEDDDDGSASSDES